MAAELPKFTEENYAALIAAIAEGVTQVQYSDKMITYRSLDDMLRLRDLMREDLCPPTNPGSHRRRVAVYYSGK